MTQGLKTHHLLILAFLLNHILHCICFEILFTESKYLVSKWSYIPSLRAIRKVKKLNKKFQIFCVIIILHNHYLIILILFWATKGFILYQIKQMALKCGYNLTDTSWIEELETQQSLSQIWASSWIFRERQATAFEPLRHIYVDLEIPLEEHVWVATGNSGIWGNCWFPFQESNCVILLSVQCNFTGNFSLNLCQFCSCMFICWEQQIDYLLAYLSFGNRKSL